MSAVCLHSVVIDRRYRSNFVIQGLGLKASAVATRAGRVSAIATEQNAHVHLVSLALKPAEKTANAVPAIVFVILVGVITRALLALNDEILIGLRQFLERCIDIDLFAGAGPEQVLLRFAKLGPAKNSHHALLDTQTPIRNRFVKIDRNRAPKSAAFGTRAEWIVEAEKPGTRRTNVEIAMGAMPAGRKGKFFDCGLRIVDSEFLP